MHDFTLPEETSARLHLLDAPLAGMIGGYRYAVLIAPLPRERATPAAFLDTLATPGGFAAALTHDRGVGWTDRAGEALLCGTIKRNGVALLAFGRRRDAENAFRKAWRAIAPQTGHATPVEWDKANTSTGKDG